MTASASLGQRVWDSLGIFQAEALQLQSRCRCRGQCIHPQRRCFLMQCLLQCPRHRYLVKSFEQLEQAV